MNRIFGSQVWTRSGLLVLLVSTSGISSELLYNGDFSQGLTGWVTTIGQGCGGSRNVAILPSDAGQSNVLQFSSFGAGGCGGSSAVYQDLNVPGSRFNSVVLSADVKAVSATVADECGFQGREYPLGFYIEYINSVGVKRSLIFAFYFGGGTCGSPESGPDEVFQTIKVPLNQWSTFRSPNLMNWITGSSRITRITIQGNGWDYDGRADNVSLSSSRGIGRVQREERITDSSPTGPGGMEFVSIPEGEFMMGCSPGDDSCYPEENPLHRVQITKPFEMGKYEVTQAQWQAVMGNNPSRFKGDDHPVEQVSWNGAQQFLDRLNARNDGYNYRLPTEAEWEYAARAGTTGPYYGTRGAIAWYIGNAGGQTHPVGQKQPNAWGLYDMLGNVMQWCQDWYVAGYYAQSPPLDPQGPTSGAGIRVERGAAWNRLAIDMRVSYRGRDLPSIGSDNNSLRVVREKK